MLNIMWIDLSKSWNLFARSFAVLFFIFPFLLLEVIFKSAGLKTFVAFTMPILMLISAAFLFVAIFKLYHHDIFKDAEYLQETYVPSVQALVLAKFLSACVWLTGFFLICVLCVRVHGLTLVPGVEIDPQALKDPVAILIEAMGSGLAGWFSIATLLVQAIALIPILYLGCTASHAKPFGTYKTLAGIFFIVGAFAVENELIAYMRILLVNMMGGIEKILSMELIQSLCIFFTIEVSLAAVFVAVNLYFTCVFLKKTEIFSNRQEYALPIVKEVL